MSFVRSELTLQINVQQEDLKINYSSSGNMSCRYIGLTRKWVVNATPPMVCFWNETGTNLVGPHGLSGRVWRRVKSFAPLPRPCYLSVKLHNCNFDIYSEENIIY
jgi:hypothetical protein